MLSAPPRKRAPGGAALAAPVGPTPSSERTGPGRHAAAPSLVQRRPPCRDDSPSLTEASQLQRRRQRRHTAHRHTRARSYHPFIFYLARGLKPYQARHHMSALRAPSYESRPTPHSRPRSHPARTLTPHTHLQNKPHHQKSMISQKCDRSMQLAMAYTSV